jgi:hypothetical protein
MVVCIVTPAQGKLRQKGHNLEASLNYKEILYLKKKKKKKKKHK